VSARRRSVQDALRLVLDQGRRVPAEDELELETLLKVAQRLERFAARQGAETPADADRIWERVRRDSEPRRAGKSC
jgi:hypothetical protein